MNTHPNNILIIAGEPSGDIRGAELLKELRPLLPDTAFWGIGGDNMENCGVDLIEHIRDLSIVGVVEIIKKLPKIRSQFKNCQDNALNRKPTAAILIDYPGFNLRLAKFLHEQKIPVIYYIIPQVWAWGSGRVKLLDRYIDKILVLFDFEKRFLKKHGVEAEFVGHPIADIPVPDKPETRKTTQTLALLPGSRETEINKLLPPMLAAARELNKKYSGNIDFLLASSSNIEPGEYDRILSKYADLNLTKILDNAATALTRADFAIVTSGTATLEASTLGTPFIIIYKSSWLTAFLARKVLKIPFIGLANIVAGKEVAPELLQEFATGDNIAKTVFSYLDNKDLLNRTREELNKTRKLLGEKGAAKRTATSIVGFINSLPV